MEFEPTVRSRVQRFSRPPRSTTPAPLRHLGTVYSFRHPHPQTSLRVSALTPQLHPYLLGLDVQQRTEAAELGSFRAA